MPSCTDFINEHAEITYIEDIIKHIDHIKKVASINCIAIGTDFDGIERTTEIDHAGEMEKLIVALINHGYTDKEISLITYQNFLRVFGMVCHD